MKDLTPKQALAMLRRVDPRGAYVEYELMKGWGSAHRDHAESWGAGWKDGAWNTNITLRRAVRFAIMDYHG